MEIDKRWWCPKLLIRTSLFEKKEMLGEGGWLLILLILKKGFSNVLGFGTWLVGGVYQSLSGGGCYSDTFINLLGGGY